MIRTQIQLTEEQYRALKSRMQKEKVSLSGAIREAVDLWLHQSTRQDCAERSIASLGRFRSGRSDISEHHDDHLAKAYGSKPVE